MTLLLMILAAIAGIAVGAIYSDPLLARYDDLREFVRRLE